VDATGVAAAVGAVVSGAVVGVTAVAATAVGVTAVAGTGVAATVVGVTGVAGTAVGVLLAQAVTSTAVINSAAIGERLPDGKSISSPLHAIRRA